MVGITGGGGNYCPNDPTTRQQAAVFFLKGEAIHCPLGTVGCTWTPPACTPPPNQRFADVPCPSQYADWIEELADEGITAGCGSGNFCPTQMLGSWQMLAWAQKVWPGYCPLPRTSVLTYRDEGARVITEANQLTSGDDTSETITYPRDNVFLGSQLVSSAVWTGTTPSYQFFAVDHLGSTRLATDMTGLIVESYKYWPYGDDGPGTGTANQRLTFAGMERDTENKHYFDHARTQDFNIGRFISADRVWGGQGAPQSWNRYSYVLNNPMSLTDPWGLATHASWCDGPCPWITWFIDLFGAGPPTSGGGPSGEGGITTGRTCQQIAASAPSGDAVARAGQAAASGAATFADAILHPVDFAMGTADAGGMTLGWLTGSGPSTMDFGPESVQAAQMASSPMVAQAVRAHLATGREPPAKFGVLQFLAAGVNPTQQFVGSFNYGFTQQGEILQMNIRNTTSFDSATYHRTHLDWERPGAMSNVSQTVTINIPCKIPG